MTLAPLTIVSDGTTSVTPRHAETWGGGIGAYAIVVHSQAITSTTTTITTTDATSSGNSATSTIAPTGGSNGSTAHPSRLSTGAIAGIGIGCAIAAILLGAMALLMWKKRRHSRQTESPNDPHMNQAVLSANEHYQRTPASYHVVDMNQMQAPKEHSDTAATAGSHERRPFNLPPELSS